MPLDEEELDGLRGQEEEELERPSLGKKKGRRRLSAGEGEESKDERLAIYEDLLLESARQTKKLSHRFDLLLKQFEEAASEVKDDKTEELLKAIAESNVVMLERLKDARQADEDGLKKLDGLQKRLSELLEGEEERIKREVKNLQGAMEDLYSELRKARKDEEVNLSMLKDEYSVLHEKLEGFVSQLRKDNAKLPREAVQAIKDSGEARKLLVEIEDSNTKNFKRELETASEALFILRDKMKKYADPDAKLVVEFAHKLDDVERRVSSLYVKVHKLPSGESFALEMEKLGKGAKDAKRELEVMGVKATLVGKPVVGSKEQRLREKAIKLGVEASKAAARKAPHFEDRIEKLSESVSAAHAKMESATPEKIQEAVQGALAAREKLEQVHKELAKGETTEGEAHKALKEVHEELRKPIDAGHVLHHEVAGHVEAMTEHAKALSSKNIAGEHLIERVQEQAETLGDNIAIATLSAPNQLVARKDEKERKIQGSFDEQEVELGELEKLYGRIDFADVAVVSEEHHEKLEDSREKMQDLVEKIREIREAQKPLEKEYSKIAEVSAKIEKKAGTPVVASQAAQIKELTSGVTAQDVLKNLEIASRKAALSQAPESLKAASEVRVALDPEKVAAKIKDYVTNFQGISEKQFNLKEMCRVFGVDYKFASDNIDKILKALGENYYTRNTDVLSRLQGKDIIIEKR